MKANKVMYREGTFTDYQGTLRPYTLCAVSVVTDACAVMDSEDVVQFTPKSVHLGLSVVHPDDVDRFVIEDGVRIPVVDKELGKTIAYGKAMKESSRIGSIHATQEGFINTAVVNALLDQEEAHFKANPGKYIAGYDKAKFNYNFEKNNGLELSDQLTKKIEEASILRDQLNELYIKSLKA